MYQINEKFLKRLSKMLGMSQRKFSELTFKHNQVWPQRMTFFDRMLLSDLVLIANRWHIPMSYMICPPEQAGIPASIDEVCLSEEEWKEVSIDVEAFKRAYQSACARKGRNEVHKSLDVTGSCVWRWMTVRFTMRARSACDFCNLAEADFHDFVKDDNVAPVILCNNGVKTAARHRTNGGESASELAENVGLLEDQVARLQKENKTLAAEVHSLSRLVEQMRGLLLNADGANGKIYAQEPELLRATGYAGNDSLVTPYGFQGETWGEGVPTLGELVERCNAEGVPTARFLINPAAVPTLYSGMERQWGGDFSPVMLNAEAVRFVIQMCGMAEVEAENVSVVDFCFALNKLHLTPACAIIDENSGYPALFADEVVRMQAEKA